MPCQEVARRSKALNPKLPVITLAISDSGHPCAPADHEISSHEPQALLELLYRLLDMRAPS